MIVNDLWAALVLFLIGVGLVAWDFGPFGGEPEGRGIVFGVSMIVLAFGMVIGGLITGGYLS